MSDDKLEKNVENIDNEDKNEIIRPLKTTKKNNKCIKIESSRFTSPTKRYGSSTTVCTSDGKLTRIYTTFNNYNRTTKIAKVYPGCMYIKAKYNKNRHSVTIYKVESINNAHKTINLKKVSEFKAGKWDNTTYLSQLKSAIKSTVKKAKKFYYFTNID